MEAIRDCRRGAGVGRGLVKVEIQWHNIDISVVVIYQMVLVVWFSKPDLYESY